MASPDPIAAERAHYLALLGRTVDDPAVTLAELRSMTGAGVDVRSAAEAKITEQRMVAGSAFVRSVNGINPDINGNVTVAGSSSELSGTGFPEGVVTAPVGTYYTDTAITNGAMRWAKKTGTGNTGWVCIVGDTGSRDISASISGTYYSGGSQARLSRVNGTVFLTMDVATIAGYTTTAVLTLPLGFAGIPSYISPGYAGTTWFGTSGTSISLNFAGANAGLRGTWSWRATDAWPTTLPGTAA